MIELAVRACLGYLLGSILGSQLMGRARGIDIRSLGSGNAGTANALRTQGKRFALGVVIIDAGKGWLACYVIGRVPLPLPVASDAIHAWLPVACGAAAMFGHVYPVWSGWHGGKAVATFFGALGGLAPTLLIPLLAVWLAVVLLSGFVSLASLCAVLMLPAAVLLVDGTWRSPLFAFAVFAALLVLFAHRTNLRRVREHREPRARRPWPLGRGTAS